MPAAPRAAIPSPPTLETQGAETRAHISTGKGFYGRLVKQDWSSRIYEAMVRNLQKPQQ
jgi:hypothetical protein